MIGLHASLERVIDNDLVRSFCDLTGDDDPLHIDEDFAARSPYGGRIAPGALMVALMMAAATDATGTMDVAVPSVGFDRVRFIAPVRVGDSVRVDYTVESFDGIRGHAAITVRNRVGDTVAVADHVFKVLVSP